MNTNTPAGDGNAPARADDRGFTLVEILIAIVLIGILSAVAVVGITSLTKSGSDSACEASRDSAKAAAVVYFAANGEYPANFTELTSGADPALELPEDTDITKDPLAAVTDDWRLTMTPGEGTSKPAFACS